MSCGSWSTPRFTSSDAQSAAFRAGGLPLPDLRDDLLRCDHGRGADRTAALPGLGQAQRAGRATGELRLERCSRGPAGLGPKPSPADRVSDAGRAAEEAISDL